MYTLKSIPEDFIVNEVAFPPISDRGDYAIFEMRKRDYTTPDAVRRIADEARKDIKDFGFAGNKDRKAITTQYISIFRGSPSLQALSLPDINLSFKGYSKKRIALGDLEGNEFVITIRGMDNAKLKAIKKFEKENAITPLPIPNYFGQQRFSSANHLIGREIVKNDFGKAAELIIQHDREYASLIGAYLGENPNNSIGALRLVRSSTLRMYIHAYQSFLFNAILLRVIGKTKKSHSGKSISSLPIIGFGAEPEGLEQPVRKIVEELLKKEGISPRNFINRQMPELSSEGAMRDAFFAAPDFRIVEEEGDERFAGKRKAVVKFTLKKSCYATVLLPYILEGCPDIIGNLP